MLLRNQVEWAIHCCAVMTGLPDGEYLATKTLAEFHGVPKEYLSKALQALAQAGIVVGTLGPTGGYRLAKAPNEISFLDIVEAIEGKKKTFECEEIRNNSPCLKGKKKQGGVCQVARVMYRADEAWRKELRATTVEDLGKAVMAEVPADLLAANAEWLSGKR
jgi:Rrf2 family protein